MKRRTLFKVLLVVLTCIILSFGFVACKDEPENNDDSLSIGTKYTLSVDTTTYNIETGETFIVPNATVTPSLPKDKAISWTVKYGTEVVEKTQDGTGFIAEKEGVYTVCYKVEGANADMIFLTVVSENALLDTAAPTSVAVSSEGVLTFTAEENREYHLYFNAQFISKINSGANIKALLPSGETQVSVLVSASVTAKASPLSQAVTVSKCAPAAVTINNGIIQFTETTGETYHLYVSGTDIGEVRNGDTLGDILIEGTNEVYVIAFAENKFESEQSNVVTYVYHPEITNFSVLKNGKINFAQIQGYIYTLLVNGVEKISVENGTDVSDLFDDLGEGEHIFQLKISSQKENFFVPEENKWSNDCSLTRLQAPTNLTVEESVLSFDAAQGTSVRLYIDGVDKGIVEAGTSLINYYTLNETMEVELTAESDTSLTSKVSESIEVDVPEEWRLLDGNILNQATYEYSDGVIVKGSQVTVKDNETVEIVKPIAFSGMLLNFAYCNKNGSYDIGKTVVCFTDISTQKTLEICFTLTKGAVDANSVYAGWKYGDAEWGYATTETNSLLSINLSDHTGGTYAHTAVIYCNDGVISFNGSFVKADYVRTFPTSPDLTGFGTNGVRVSIRSEKITSNDGSAKYMIIAHGAKQAYEQAEYQTYTFGGVPLGQTSVYTIATPKTPITVKENVAFTGELLNVGFDFAKDGVREWNYATVRFVDRATSKILDIKLFLNNDAINMAKGVYIYWEYDGDATTYKEEEAKWNLNIASKRILSIAYDQENGVTFNNSSFKRKPDLSGFGANGVDIQIIIDTFTSTFAETRIVVGDMRSYLTEENASVTYTGGYTGTVTGTKYTVLKAGEYITVAEDVQLQTSNPLAKIAFCLDSIGAATEREWTTAIIQITDGTNTLYVKIAVPNQGFNYVNMSYSWDGVTYSTAVQAYRWIAQNDASGIDQRCTPLSIYYDETAGFKFFEPFSTFGSSSFSGLTLPTGFGANGVDIKICIGDFANGNTSTSFIVEK